MPSEGSGAWLKRFKAKQKSREDEPAEASGTAATSGSVPSEAAATGAGAAAADVSSPSSAQAGPQLLDIAVADVLDDDGFVREDANVDDDVAEAVQAMHAEANAKRLRRRRMGIAADGAQADDAVAGDGHTIRLRVDASGAVIKSDQAAVERRRVLASGSAAGSVGVLQSDFADTGKRERPAASELGAPGAARQRVNPRQREQELSRRAEAVRNHRLALRRAEEEKASLALSAADAEQPAGSEDGALTLDSIVNNGGGAANAAPSTPEVVTASQVVNAGVWSSAPTTDAAAEPSVAAAPKAETAPPATTTDLTTSSGTAAGAVATDKPKKKKTNVFAVAKQLVKERSGGEHVHGGGASAVDKTYGRRDEQGRLLSATEAFKALSKDFDTSRGK